MDGFETARQIRAGALSSRDATELAIDRIKRLNPLVNAVVTPLFDRARADADELDRCRQRGDLRGPLHGVPILIKDLFDPLEGVRNTFGCTATRDYVADATAMHVQRLIDAGAVIVGKTNTPEFGHKGVTDNRLFGATSTPFDLDRNAGGSSGGSAAAVAAGMVPIAQGSDAGGSIRIPAAWCGVVGFKPSYGRIPNGGGGNVFGMHTPFVHTGPITETVRDAALVAAAMSGPGDDDPFSLPPCEDDWLRAALEPCPSFRVRVAADFGGFAVDAPVAEVFSNCITALASGGIAIEHSDFAFSVSQDDIARLWRRQVGLAYAEVFAAFTGGGPDFLDQHRDEIPEPIHEMVDRARRQSALDARGDDALRTRIYRELQHEMAKCDILLTPTLGALPVANRSDGTTTGPTTVGGHRTEPTIGWCLTHPINFTGHPAMSIPAGLTADGLPVGLQIIGRRHRDEDVIAFAAEVERRRPWIVDLQAVRAKIEQLSTPPVK